jgi:hypothetical protein
VLTAVLKGDPRRCHQVDNHAGHEHLVGLSQRRNPRANPDGDPTDVLAGRSISAA